MEKKQRTEIASLGQFGLIDLLTRDFALANASTVEGVGDDAAVIAPASDEVMLCTTDSFYEGVDFDLTYFPLKHLGYKVITAGVSDILAMNALPRQVTVSLGVSSKLPVEALQDLYEGISFACREQRIDLVGGDTRASMTGLVITVTVLGAARRERVAYRRGAKLHDLVCITGNLGADCSALPPPRRRRPVLSDCKNPEPRFEVHEDLLEKYLKPRPRTDIVEALAEEWIVPTSMIDLSDGLASDMLQLCRASKCGVRLYLERIPIAQQTTRLSEEMHSDPVVAALHGGEDYELLFTVPLAMQEQVMRMGGIDVIGHITSEESGAFLVTPDGAEIRLRAQGFPDGEIEAKGAAPVSGSASPLSPAAEGGEGTAAGGGAEA